MKKHAMWLCALFALMISISLYWYFHTHKTPSNDGGDLMTVRVSDTRFMGILPLYVADEKGFFRKHGIRLEWLDVRDPGQAQNLFFSGQADLLMTTFPSILPAEVRSPGSIRLLCPTYESKDQPGSFILVPPNSEIRSVEDLKGRRIGTYNGASQKMYAIIVLDSLGLREPDDIRLVQVASSAQVQGLFGGSFDALFTVEPYGSTAILQGANAIESGVRTRRIADPFWLGSVAIPASTAEEKPELTEAILASLQDAVSFILQHQNESREILARRTGISSEVASRCALYTWCLNPNAGDLQQLQEASDALVRAGLLDKPVDMKELLVTTQSAHRDASQDE